MDFAYSGAYLTKLVSSHTELKSYDFFSRSSFSCLFDDYALSESMAFINLQANYPEKWINPFPNYDPNNNGDYAYFAVFTNPDKHTITSVITVDLVTGRANEKNLATGKITSINIL